MILPQLAGVVHSAYCPSTEEIVQNLHGTCAVVLEHRHRKLLPEMAASASKQTDGLSFKGEIIARDAEVLRCIQHLCRLAPLDSMG